MSDQQVTAATAQWKLLMWCDTPTKETGFARVTQNLAGRFAASGKFSGIHIWGIHYFGYPGKPNEETPKWLRPPFRIYPAGEPWYSGERLQALLDHIVAGNYTHLWIMQDHFLMAREDLPKVLLEQCRGKGVAIFFYCPVDGRMQGQWTLPALWADHPVAYTRYGQEEILRAMRAMGAPEDCIPRIGVLPHGVDTTVYKPIVATPSPQPSPTRGEGVENSPQPSSGVEHKVGCQAMDGVGACNCDALTPKPTKGELRAQMFQDLEWLKDGDVLLINVNMNQRRKDAARSLEVLKALRALPGGEKYKLLMHMNPKSTDGVDLEVIAAALGFTRGKEWGHSGEVFEGSLGTLSEEMLNRLYNCADGYLTTSLGEGWGFGMTEALAAGLPVFAPDHTACRELSLKIEEIGDGEIVLRLPLESYRVAMTNDENPNDKGNPKSELSVPLVQVLPHDNSVPRQRVDTLGAAQAIDQFFKTRDGLRSEGVEIPKPGGLSERMKDWLSWDRIAGRWLDYFSLGQRKERWDCIQLTRIGKGGAAAVRDAVGLRAHYMSRFWLYVEEDDKAFTPHYRSGVWEVDTTRWIQNQIFPASPADNPSTRVPDLFIDIGGNVGFFGMFAASLGMPTHIFEPQKKLAEMIDQSIKINGFKQRATVWNFALWNKKETGGLVIPTAHSGGAFKDRGAKPHVDDYQVEGVRFEVFDEWFEFFYHSSAYGVRSAAVIALAEKKKLRVAMKIDAEGAEPEIVEGMARFLAANEVSMTLEWDARRWPESCPDGAQEEGGKTITKALAFARELQRIGKGRLTILDKRGWEVAVTPEELENVKEIRMVCLRNF